MKFHELPSKAAQVRFMKEKMATDDLWMVRGLLTIYAHQTADEQRNGENTIHNGVGFRSSDAQYLTSVCHNMLHKNVEAAIRNPATFNVDRYLSEKQLPIVRKKMLMYSDQLCRIARLKK